MIHFWAIAFGDNDDSILEKMAMPFPEGHVLRAVTPRELESTFSTSFSKLQNQMSKSELNWECKSTCKKYEYPTADFTRCLADSCDPVKGQYLLETGKCGTCNQYMVVTDDGKGCKECLSNQYINKQRKCETCVYPNKPAKDRMSCLTVCQGDTALIDGKCQKCPSHKHPNAGNSGCISETCDKA